MNKVFKVIWNATSQSWVAVSELGKAKTKTKSVSLAVAGALAIASGAVNAGESFVRGEGAAAAQADSVAIGTNAQTELDMAIAIGKDSKAVSYGDIAIGAGAHAETAGANDRITERQSAIAIGTNAQANKINSVSIGNYANATAAGSTALGNNATAAVDAATALGEESKSTGRGSLAAGANSEASGQASSALGDHAVATAERTTATGASTKATELGSSAFGTLSEATGVYATATGAEAIASEQNTVASGALAKATGYASSATGFNSNASAQNASAMGSNSVASSTGATAVGASSQATGQAASAFGASSTASGDSSTALGQNSQATASNSNALGFNAQATDINTLAIGTSSQATNWSSSAVGTGAKATGIGSASFGYSATADGYRSTSIGTRSQASGSASVAMGYGATATNAGNIAIGESAATSGRNAIGIGQGASVQGENSVAIGSGNTVTAKNAFVFGTNVIDPHENSVILGADSKAVGYTAAPNTVVTSVDGSEAYTYNATKYAGHVDGAKAGNYVSIGSEGNERQIKNMAAGTISAGSTDGVNGSQLYAVMERLEFVSKTGFNVGENNTAGDVTVNGNTANSTNVGLQNNINFNNGHLTVARVEAGQGKDQNDANVYYDVVTQALATDATDGKAAVGTQNAQSNGKDFATKDQPAAPNANALTTAQNVADAINASGWKIAGNNAAGEASESLVNPGDKVTFANGTATTAVVETAADGSTTVKYNINVDEVTTQITNGSFAVKTVPLGKEGTAAAGDQKSTVADADKNAIATAGDVVNAVNSARETVVSKDKTVTVTKAENAFGGTEYDLSIKTNSDTVKFTDAGVLEVATATIAPADAATGVVAAPNTANGTIATAADVVNAINSAGWLVENTDGTTSVVNAGDKVVYANGTGTTATVETVDGTTTVKYSVNTDGSKTTKFDPTTNTVEVATGTVSPADATTGVVAPADKTAGTIATVDDVVNAVNSVGFVLKGNGEQKDVVTAGDSLNFVNGNATTAEVNANGDVTFNVNTDGTTVSIKDGNLQVTTAPVKQTGSAAAGTQKSETAAPNAIATAGDLVNAVNSARETVTSNNKTVIVTPSANGVGGTNYDLAVRVDGNTVQINNRGELVANAVINLQDGINTKVTQVQTADGTRVYQIDANKDLVDINSIQINGPKGADGTNGKDGATLNVGKGPAGVDGLGTDGQPGTEKTRIVYQPLDANGNPVVDANGNPVVENVATLNDGLVFGGDTGTDSAVKLNKKVTVKGGQKDTAKLSNNPNVGVVSDGKGNLEVKLAKDVDLGEDSSVKAGTVTVAGKDGANVALTSNKGQSFNTAGKADGGSVDVLNVGTAGKPTRVTNVANGEISATSKDAINGSQLHAVANNINNRIDGVDKRVGKLDKRVRGVGANAAAAAALPQVYIPGKSMVAASAGGYGGASALAVGYSRASDNGRTILKLQGTVNSQGHVSGGVGVGFQW